ncbi:MAG: division/cell wall cluster transcriptional repressor MraZ [Clostridia bacterium]|nr:division/cell wall cluster transcriptional repressor MraZ [Clostridia bacterium]
MLTGSYNHTIDNKGRVFIPAGFRDYLSETNYAYKGLDDCISIYSETEWAKLIERLNKTGYLTEMKFRRFFMASAKELSADAQGRISLPLELRKRANIEKDVVVIGMDDHIEIWNDASLENETLSIDKAELEARLRELGL